MASVKVLHRTAKLNLAGESPIYLRIIKDRRARFISTGIYVHPKDWDEKERRVKKSHPNYQQMNAFIDKKKSLATDKALEMETKSKYVTTRKIKEDVMGKSSESFMKFFERHLQELEHNKQMGTLDKAQSVYSKLKKYLNDQDILFNDIDVNWLRTYESYLRTELNNSTNTIHSNLKVIRKLINAAIAEDIFPMEKNPFHRFKLKWQQVKKEYLTEEELQKIEELQLEKNSKKDHHRNMYVFAAYTGGLRISDILQLRWKNYDGEKLFVHTQKTSSSITIKLPNKSLEILESYKSKKSKPTEFIFPILRNDLDYSDARKVFNAISSATAYTNTDLKDIAKAAGIEKHLHFHTSRHTWATRALYKGMRMEYVSKLMGHSSIKTTQIYAKIVNEELDKAMEVFN